MDEKHFVCTVQNLKSRWEGSEYVTGPHECCGRACDTHASLVIDCIAHINAVNVTANERRRPTESRRSRPSGSAAGADRGARPANRAP